MEQTEHLEDLCKTLPRPWAVVGNGAAHLKVGELIDTFPTVVRFNEYVIDGYEEYVGTKTTLRSVGWEPQTPRPVPMISPFIPRPFTEAWRTNERNKAAGIIIVRPRKGTGKAGLYATSGYALLKLLNRERVETTVFHMDGLQSAHYWDASHEHWTWHKGAYEWREIQRMPYIGIYAHQFDRI